MQGREPTNTDSHTPNPRKTRQARERDTLALYALTLALEAPAVLARYLVTRVVVGVLLSISGSNGDPTACGWLVALGPIVWSALAFVEPRGGGDWWRARLGGRSPSQREREALARALSRMQARTHSPLLLFERWFVRDDPRCEAAIYGTRLMLSSGALGLREDHLAALLAHELGHLHGIDAKLTVALNRLVLKPLHLRMQPPDAAHDGTPGGGDPHDRGDQRETGRRPSARELMLVDRRARNTLAAMGLTRWLLSTAMALMRGGVSLHLTAPAWAALLRAQEYDADEWAADLGWARELADFLETNVLDFDHPIPLVGMSSQPHPPTELRIDRLRNRPGYAGVQGQTGEPVWIGAREDPVL